MKTFGRTGPSIYLIGDSALDIECVPAEGLRKDYADFSVGGKEYKSHPCIVTRPDVCIGFRYDGHEYYGKIDIAKGKEGGTVADFGSSGGRPLVAIKTDAKLDFETANQLGIRSRPTGGDILDFNYRRLSSGGGSTNNARAASCCMNGMNGSITLIPLVGDGHVAREMKSYPHPIDYMPALPSGCIPYNFVAMIDGKKLNVRGKPTRDGGELRFDRDELNITIPEMPDVLAVNSVKSRDYIDEIMAAAAKSGRREMFVMSTDSMIRSLGKDKVLGMLSEDGTHLFCNEEELAMLWGINKLDGDGSEEKRELYRGLVDLRESRLSDTGRVFVTRSERGMAVLGSRSDAINKGRDCMYHQRAYIVPDGRAVRTNALGDTNAGFAVTTSAMGFDIESVIATANAAAGMWIMGGSPDMEAIGNMRDGRWPAKEGRVGEQSVPVYAMYRNGSAILDEAIDV
jgi:hypothetical protein